MKNAKNLNGQILIGQLNAWMRRASNGVCNSISNLRTDESKPSSLSSNDR